MQSPTRRASSASPQSSGGSNIDPVLARYHAIKRQMEDQGGSIYATPPPSGTGTGATPRRAQTQQQHGITPSNNTSTRYGTPAPGPTAPAPAPSLSLYTAVLTPGADAKASGAKIVGGNDARMMQSPTVPVLRPLGASGRENAVFHNSSVHQCNQHQHQHQQGVVSEVVLEAERRRTRELDETRRALQVDRDRQRERVAELEDRVRLEHAAAAEAQSHVAALKSEAERSGALLSGLHADVAARGNEISALRERQLHLERKLLDAEQELAQGGGGTSQRVLAGKVAALEDLLRTKQGEVDEEQRRARIAALQADEARDETAAAAGAAQAKDRELGELHIALTEARRAKEKADERANDAIEHERAMEAKLDAADEKLRAASESAEGELRSHKEDVRAKQRELQKMEISMAALQEEVKEAAALKVQLETDAARLREEAATAHRDGKTWQARAEALQVLQAGETTAKDEARRDAERLKAEASALHEELRAHVRQCEAYESLLNDADKEKDVRDALDAQVRVLQASFARQEQDNESLRAQYDNLARRCAGFEDDAARLTPLERAKAEADALAELRLEQIDALRKRIGVFEAEAEAASEQYKSARLEGEEAKRDFVASHERCLQLQGEIVDLENELSVLGEAQEKLARLNDAFEERGAHITHLSIELQSWQQRFKEADAEATGLRSYMVKLQAAEDKLAAAHEQLEHREDAIRALERKNAAMGITLREYEDERAVSESTRGALESDVARLNGQLADKAELDRRLRGSIVELQARQDELAKERNRALDLQTRLRERDDAAASERARRIEVETAAHDQGVELTKMQVELGRVTVMLESAEKEKQRLEHVAADRARHLEAKMEMLSKMDRDAAEKDEALRVKAITDTNTRHEIELSELRMRELATQLSHAKRAVDEQKELVRKYEAERRDHAGKAESLLKLEEKLMAAEAQLATRDDELASAERHVAQLKQRMKEQQTEMAALRQTESRVGELKALMDRQSTHLDAAAREDAAKSQKLIEKERELGRARERLASVGGELDTEKLRREQAEATARELEAASSKAIQLEGQLAGLHQVMAQRTRDLDESRALVSELRERLRNAGARSGGSVGQNSLASAELDAKVRAKDETIARLEGEEQRRHALVEQLRKDLAAAAGDRSALERQLADAQARLDRGEVSWRSRCTRLEAELDEARKHPQTDGRARRLEEELLDMKCRNTTLGAENDRLKREIASMSGDGATARHHHDSSDTSMNNSAFSVHHRVHTASDKLQSELRRTRASLEGIHGGGGGGGGGDATSSSSPTLSPEPKKRTVRSVLNSSAASGGGGGGASTTKSFLRGSGGSPLNL